MLKTYELNILYVVYTTYAHGRPYILHVTFYFSLYMLGTSFYLSILAKMVDERHGYAVL